MPALAITDHGTLSGHRELYRIAKAKGVKPILGVEGYFCSDRFDKRAKSERTEPTDMVYNHIVLLAKNQLGLENLNKINEIAWTEGYFSKPRFDFEVLEKYSEGIIVLSGCLSGIIAKALEHGEYAQAKKHIAWFDRVFKDDFYMELMPHNGAEVNKQLADLADEFKIQTVVTPDCHHVDESQKEIQEFKLLMNSHAKVQKDITYEKSKKQDGMMKRLDYLYGEDRQMSFNKFDIHLLSYDEMKAAMESQGIVREDMYTNSISIADKVEDYDIKDGLNLLPVQYKNPNQELSNLAFAGLEQKRLTPNWLGNDEYEVRLMEELEIKIKEALGAGGTEVPMLQD
jgi:DNA polymerase-3 subunit alpha